MLFRDCFPFPEAHVGATPLFSLLATKKFNNDFKKEGVSCYLSCKESSQLLCGLRAKPATRVKIPEAMRIRGYSQSKVVDRALQVQGRREAEKIEGGVDCRGCPARRGAMEEGGEVCGCGSDHQDAADVVVVVAPPDRMGPGQSHAGRTRVDWVARKRRQEAA